MSATLTTAEATTLAITAAERFTGQAFSERFGASPRFWPSNLRMAIERSVGWIVLENAHDILDWCGPGPVITAVFSPYRVRALSAAA